MGASHSTEPRTVSMENPNPAGVVELSDDVVKRLKAGITQQVKDRVAAEHAAASTSSQPQQKQETRAVPVNPSAPATPVTPPVATPLAPTPPIVFQAPTTHSRVQTPMGATMTALDVRRQKEIELQENDAMWRQRMAQLEQTLNKTNTIMEQEYSSALEDVRKRFANAAPVHQLPPCQDLKAKVIRCYRKNPGETLKCAEEVASFRNCVAMHRVKKLDEAKDEEATSKTDVKMLASTVAGESAKAA